MFTCPETPPWSSGTPPSRVALRVDVSERHRTAEDNPPTESMEGEGEVSERGNVVTGESSVLFGCEQGFADVN